MREIKFKAKSEKTDVWVFGTYYRLKHLSQTGESGINRYSHYIVDDEAKCHEVNPLTLCQFIELQDNFVGNNHDLFDNDMVVVRYEGEWSVHRIMYQARNDYPAFELHPYLDAIETNGISCAISELGYVIKRIGNYYDNPEKWSRLI